MATVAREEGAAALWNGIGPGIHRQVLFGCLRIGLYEPIKDLYVGKELGDVPLHLKVAAGLTTGAVGITIASPTDLVKVRMQAEGAARGRAAKVPERVQGVRNNRQTGGSRAVDRPRPTSCATL